MLLHNPACPDGNKKRNFKMVVTYNDKGRLAKTERINAEGAIYHTASFTYDNDGLSIKATIIKDDEPAKNLVYEYCSTCKQSWKR